MWMTASRTYDVLNFYLEGHHAINHRMGAFGCRASLLTPVHVCVTSARFVVTERHLLVHLYSYGMWHVPAIKKTPSREARLNETLARHVSYISPGWSGVGRGEMTRKNKIKTTMITASGIFGPTSHEAARAPGLID